MPNSEALALINQYYPHIATRITAMWGKPALNSYMENLLNNTREGNRQGFPMDVASAMMKILDQHHQDFPQWFPDDGGVWELKR